MRQHSRRVGLAWFQVEGSDGLFSGEIPHRDRSDLHGRFRESGNAQDRTGRRIHWKIVDKGFVQFAVLIHVSKINLHVNNVRHSEARCFDHIFYTIE